MSYSVAIVGASGSAGSEIARIVSGHPELEVSALTAASSAGTRFGDLNPHIPGLADKIIQPTDAAQLAEADVVFVALPHGQSAEITGELSALDGPIIIDAGADHRLTSAEAWSQYYGGEYPGAWDYAMPELIHADEAPALLSGNISKVSKQREALKSSKTIAVPGCNVTAVTLAMMPAVAAGFVSAGHLSATLSVGYSGAGRSLKPHLMATSALSNMAPYSAAGKHRHIPEIIQNLQVAGAGQLTLDFTPVLVPTSRGILAVVNTMLEGVSDQAVQDAYRAAYDAEAFIDVTNGYPQTQPILATGKANVWAGVDPHSGSLTAIAAIDNLGKGTASAAVQAANLALGLDEQTGIPTIGVAP
ncbi:MAG: Asd/ArgC dimerization domain-containing protein [Actinomycetaceae bacterium]|nr:Asd/ArgC dimerization domain-containing protein [Actinomycetaceae bacterium]